MQRLLSIVAYSLLFLACNDTVAEKPSTYYFIDPSVREYYLDFKSDVESIGLEIGNKNKSFSIILGRTPINVAGIAIGMFNEYAVNVVIDITIWNRLNKAEKKALIYHELAHDVFGLEHNTCDLMSGGLRAMTEEMRIELLETLKQL